MAGSRVDCPGRGEIESSSAIAVPNPDQRDFARTLTWACVDCTSDISSNPRE